MAYGSHRARKIARKSGRVKVIVLNRGIIVEIDDPFCFSGVLLLSLPNPTKSWAHSCVFAPDENILYVSYQTVIFRWKLEVKTRSEFQTHVMSASSLTLDAAGECAKFTKFAKLTFFLECLFLIPSCA